VTPSLPKTAVVAPTSATADTEPTFVLDAFHVTGLTVRVVVPGPCPSTAPIDAGSPVSHANVATDVSEARRIGRRATRFMREAP
jgi:hypothetical protein